MSGMNMTREKKSLKIFAWLILMLSICVMTICGHRLWEKRQIDRESNDSYERLAGLVRHDGPPSFHTPGTANRPEEEPEADKAIYFPDMSIDFPALQAITPDASAWLYCPGTVIDYPVMLAADYDYYLNHLPDGTCNANGSLFIDYNCAPDFSDELTIIYGHHMKSGRMFGTLAGYKRQTYFEQNPYMYLYTKQDNYRIDLVYGCVIGAGEWRERAFMFQENLKSLLAYAAHNTTFISGAEYTEADKVIVLSTCSYEFDGARYVVIGVLRPEYDREKGFDSMFSNS